MRYKALLCITLLSHLALPAQATLQDSIKKIKPSVVAIGVFSPLASPRVRLVGTGFVVADGRKIITNYHVIAKAPDVKRNESYVVLSGQADNIQIHQITDTKTQTVHDLAVLTIEAKLPAATLAGAEFISEGTEIAFTGFPITAVLGLYPATHRGIISAVTPIAIPADHSGQLQASALRQLRQPFMVYQLDATAYPGNSGSPVFDINSGEVIGVINMVFLKGLKESALTHPSGISYAIPANFLGELIRQSAP